jgi:hypothetical protein
MTPYCQTRLRIRAVVCAIATLACAIELGIILHLLGGE